MWYEGDDGFGYATSVDGINWIKDTNNNPVLVPGSNGSWDELDIDNASVLFIDNIYHLWYSGIDGLNDNRIGHATSPDGINWLKDTANPVLNLGSPGSWDDHEVMHPFVICENDTLKMWYNGHDGVTQRILYATSLDGTHWNRFTQHPILEPGTGGQWDSNELGPLSVLYFDNHYHMWYTGWNFANLFQIGYATSANGIHWIKHNVVLSPGDSGDWDHGGVALPFVMVDVEDSLYKMWYGSSDGVFFQTGYATSALLVSVNELVELMPTNFVLNQNYPNPFNPSTKIIWQSPVGSWQTLKVFDVLGNEVTTLVDEYKPAGDYEVDFYGKGLSSGIYFYQLKAGSFVETKTMVLIK